MVFSRNIHQPALGTPPGSPMTQFRYGWPLGPTNTGTDENGDPVQDGDPRYIGRGVFNSQNFGSIGVPSPGYPLHIKVNSAYMEYYMHPHKLHLYAG